MSALCPSACTVADLPTAYFTCNTVTRSACAKYAVLIKCDYVFTDVLDSTEWTTAKTAGDIISLPPGNMTINVPDFTSIEIDCDNEIAADIAHTVDYETYQVSTTLADYTFWRTVQANPGSYRLMIIDSHNDADAFWVSDAFATAIDAGAPAASAGNSPGFAFSLPTLPHPEEGDGRRMKWVAQFKIKYEGIPQRRQLPGVRAAVCGA